LEEQEARFFGAPANGRGAFFVLFPSKIQCQVCMVKEIREWLESGQDYAQGVALYERVGKSRVILNALRRGASDFTRQKLREELPKLILEEVVPPARVRVVDTAAKRVEKTPARVHAGPPAAQVASPAPEHPERRTWYANRAYAHAQLELVDTDAARRELATSILAASAQITASYRAVEAPADVAPGPDLAALADEGEIRRLLANLRPQRSKLKNRPDRAGDLARVVAQITLLETKLKTRDGD
jgi:hypothetical protein